MEVHVDVSRRADEEGHVPLIVGILRYFAGTTCSSTLLYASSGVSARTGNSYDLLGIAWQYVGRGL